MAPFLCQGLAVGGGPHLCILWKILVLHCCPGFIQGVCIWCMGASWVLKNTHHLDCNQGIKFQLSDCFEEAKQNKESRLQIGSQPQQKCFTMGQGYLGIMLRWGNQPPWSSALRIWSQAVVAQLWVKGTLRILRASLLFTWPSEWKQSHGMKTELSFSSFGFGSLCARAWEHMRTHSPL